MSRAKADGSKHQVPLYGGYCFLIPLNMYCWSFVYGTSLCLSKCANVNVDLVLGTIDCAQHKFKVEKKIISWTGIIMVWALHLWYVVFLNIIFLFCVCVRHQVSGKPKSTNLLVRKEELFPATKYASLHIIGAYVITLLNILVWDCRPVPALDAPHWLRAHDARRHRYMYYE